MSARTLVLFTSFCLALVASARAQMVTAPSAPAAPAAPAAARQNTASAGQTSTNAPLNANNNNVATAQSSPIPGTELVLGTDGNVYFVRQISPPPSASVASTGAPTTRVRAPTRVVSYGPTGGDNVRGEILLYELTGNFRFTHLTQKERMALARATHQSTK